MDCSQLDNGEEEEDAVPEAEGYTEEEEAMGLAALTDVFCRRCNKKGHFARNCKLPPPVWKGGKAGGKGTRFMTGYNPGKGGQGRAKPPGPPCPHCGKNGHGKEGCWKLHPELTPP